MLDERCNKTTGAHLTGKQPRELARVKAGPDTVCQLLLLVMRMMMGMMTKIANHLHVVLLVLP